MRAVDGAPRGARRLLATARATPAAEAVAAAAAQAVRRRRPSTPRGAAACRPASAARVAPRRAPPRLEWPRCLSCGPAFAGSRRPRAPSRRRRGAWRAQQRGPAAAARSRRGRRSQSRGRSSSSRPARARAPRFARAAAVPRSVSVTSSSPPRRLSWFHDCWLRRTIQCRSPALLRSQRINAAGSLPRDAVSCLSKDGFVRRPVCVEGQPCECFSTSSLCSQSQ